MNNKNFKKHKINPIENSIEIKKKYVCVVIKKLVNNYCFCKIF